MRVHASVFGFYFILYSLLQQNEARQGGNVANRYFLEKQKFLTEILIHVEEPILNREWLFTGNNLILNNSNYVEFNKEMLEFQARYEMGSLLHKKAIFNLFNNDHHEQVKALFYYFYNANDWETLLLNACWARAHMHPHMFVYAFTQALLKRCDLKNLLLPQIYEILPKLFVNAESVHTALRFDYAQFSRMKYLYKDLHHFKRQTHEIYVKPQKGAKNYTKVAQQPRALAELTKFFLNTAQKLNDNLKEDIAWHAYWYYQNMGLLWLEEFNNQAELSVVEIWFNILGQILARYNLKTSILQKFKTEEKSSQLLYLNKSKFREFSAKSKAAALTALANQAQQVQAIIGSETLTLKNGTVVALRNGKNWAVMIEQIFGKSIYDLYKRFYLVSAEEQSSPTMLSYFEIQLRDPNFYELAEILFLNYRQLHGNFKSQNFEKLKQTDLVIEQVSISKLQTFHEIFHFDGSCLLTTKHFYYDGNLFWQKSLMLHQKRLQHKAFNINFNITAKMQQKVLLRSFLVTAAPKNLFFQLDAFSADLQAGSNLLTRNSTAFFDAPQRAQVDLSILHRLVMLGLDNQYNFPLNISTAKCGFPQHLLLPSGEGHGNGLEVKFFFIVTPFAKADLADKSQVDCDFEQDYMRYDNLRLNFYTKEFLALLDMPNSFWKKAEIYHKM